VAGGAVEEGAEVRLRRVAEQQPEMLISFKQHWGRHRSELKDQTDASIGDLEWADGIAFGTPTRFGNVAAQLEVFLDLAGELWERGALVDKVATSFTSSQTEHGDEVFGGGGNPCGASYTSNHRLDGQPDGTTLAVARAQGARLARITHVIAA